MEKLTRFGEDSGTGAHDTQNKFKKKTQDGERKEDKETSEENERRPVNRDSLELKVDGTNETER